MHGAAMAKQWQGVEGVVPAGRRPSGQRAALLGLRLVSDAAAPIEQLTALELYRRLEAAPAERPAVTAELDRRRGLDPAPGSTGYWSAFKDAYALIRGLEAAEADVRRADHDFAYTFSDGEWHRFGGSYAEFKAARLDCCVQAQEALTRLRSFAAGFPMVAKLLAAKVQEQQWRRWATV